MPMQDGPSLQQYVETRFNLLIEAMGKMDQALRERIDANSRLREALEHSVAERFTHSQQTNALIAESSKRAIDKAEGAQHAHNIASNEWRSTLNDFKNTLVGKGEFEQLRSDFAAYRLEQSRLNSLQAGAQAAQKETKEDNKALWALVISIASAAVMVVLAFLRH